MWGPEPIDMDVASFDVTGRMTKYLIINAFSARNAGDAAIVLATAALLRENGDAMVRSATRYFEQDREYYAPYGIEVVPPLVPFPPRPAEGLGPQRFLALLAGTLAALVIVCLSRFTHAGARRIAQFLGLEGLLELLSADRVILCGGGYLFSARRALNLTLVHTAVSTKLAELAGKAPLMMPQSVGPLHRRLDRVLVSWAFCKVRPFVVRDEFAREEARDVMSRTAGDIEVCPDIAFAGWPSSRYIEPAKTGKPSVRRIGIVPMDWTWARTVDRERALDAYIAKLAAVVRNLSHQGFELQLYGHSRIAEMDQDDFAVAQRIAETAGADANVHLDLAGGGDVTELREHFRSVSVVVGTRLHSCIIAMLMGTPAIGLAYQPKSLGTFRLLGLEDYCLDVESFEADRVAQLAAGLAGQRAGRRDDVLIERVAEAHKRIQAVYTPHLTSGVTTAVSGA